MNCTYQSFLKPFEDMECLVVDIVTELVWRNPVVEIIDEVLCRPHLVEEIVNRTGVKRHHKDGVDEGDERIDETSEIERNGASSSRIPAIH